MLQHMLLDMGLSAFHSDINKDWTPKEKDKDKDLTLKDKDLNMVLNDKDWHHWLYNRLCRNVCLKSH
jgi:hypothetical protein